MYTYTPEKLYGHHEGYIFVSLLVSALLIFLWVTKSEHSVRTILVGALVSVLAMSVSSFVSFYGVTEPDNVKVIGVRMSDVRATERGSVIVYRVEGNDVVIPAVQSRVYPEHGVFYKNKAQ